MDSTEYFWLTRKKNLKPSLNPDRYLKRSKNISRLRQHLQEELEDLAIGFESKFQPIHTKHWRFDFHIVKLRLLIEIEGGPRSGGRGGKLANKAWSLDRYDQAEEMGYKIERFHPDSILSGYVINWIKSELARIEDGANKTISTD